MASKKKKKNQNLSGPSSQKKLLFLFLLLLPIPLLLLGIEGLLQITDYGVDPRPFHALTQEEGLLRDNLDYVFLFHPKTRKSQTTIYRSLFTKEKTPGTLRGLVLGGSTAEGFPYTSNHSFSAILAKGLQYATGKRVEILNLGFSAMSSYYLRHASSKILDLDLDFVILYTGHNEFYGTISYTTGANHFSNLLNMSLKNSRLFQAFFNFLSPEPPKGEETLMARQFAQNQILPESSINREVAQRLVDNLKKTSANLQEGGIPVFILSPISNLLDMPPFIPKDQTTLSAQVLEWGRKAMQGDREAAALILEDPSYDEGTIDPLQLYLQSLAQYKILPSHDRQEEKILLDQFLRAKDLDPVPFRAREEVNQILAQEMENLEGVYFIHTQEEFFQKYGLKAFSNLFFIDHLHFNIRGQQAVAELLATEMISSPLLKEASQEKLQEYFSQESLVQQSIFFLSIYDYAAKNKIAKLLEAPPYSLMALPYTPNTELLGVNQDYLYNNSLMEKIRTTQADDILTVYAEDLLGQEDYDTYLLFLQSFNQINPGSPETHYASANFFAQFPSQNNDKIALQEYRRAIVLAHEPEQMRKRIDAMLRSLQREDLIQELQ